MLTSIIYRRDANGSIRTWQGQAVNGQWRSRTGVLGGATVTSEWADAPPRSQPTAVLQAEFEMTAQLKKLLGKDYRISEALVDVPRGSFIKPMLAQTYKGFEGTKGIFVKKYWSQPKLDGMRCLTNIDGMWSRGAKQIFGAPHIRNVLDNFFNDYPNIVLDGELYNHDLHDDFNKILSIVRKLSPNELELSESEAIMQYWIYDCYIIDNPTAGFSERQGIIQILRNEFSSIEIVPSFVCITEEDIRAYHIKFVGEGYEGSILRLNAPYEQKRSKTLLKNKDFITEEFQLIGIEEGSGNWSGYAKRAVCQTPEGIEFGAGIKGNQEYCRELLSRSPGEFESVTIRHFGKTPDGSIRFPIAISFNEKGSLESRPVGDGMLNSDDTSMEF